MDQCPSVLYIVTNTDFAELFLDYADAELAPAMQGASFRANLPGDTPSDWPDAMYYHYRTHQPERPSHYGIRTARLKLIYYDGVVRMGRAPEDCRELYDLERDPRELFNRYAEPEYADDSARLERRLCELRTAYGDTVDPLTLPIPKG